MQSFSFGMPDAELLREIELQLLDPQLSGRPPPEPTGETVTINSKSMGPLTVQIIVTGTNEDEVPRFGIGWETGEGLWFTITSDAPGNLAREEALAVAEQVDFTRSLPLVFPFQLGYVPAGLNLVAALRITGTDGHRQAGLDFAPDPQTFPALQVSAVNTPGLPEGFTPNTTVGRYPAWLHSEPYAGLNLTYFVEGLLINISVYDDSGAGVDEQQMRQIAESLLVFPGAATDDSVWTTQPLG